MIEIERLVFVCPDIEEACNKPEWNNFCIGPIRQTRSYLKSRYILFKNIMLELLQVTDFADGEKFVFFEEWQQARFPTWVSIGYKVDNMESALAECEKYGIFSQEEFKSSDPNYKNGFRYRSCLLSKTLLKRPLYITEYDDQFFIHRHDSICTDSSKKNAYSVHLPHLFLEDLTAEKMLDIEEQGRIKLNIINHFPSKNGITYNFDWIVLQEVKAGEEHGERKDSLLNL